MLVLCEECGEKYGCKDEDGIVECSGCDVFACPTDGEVKEGVCGSCRGEEDDSESVIIF